MTRFIAVFCLAVGLTATLHAQTPARVTPEQVDKIFAKWNKPDSPGCALAVLQNGGAAYERGYGMADLEHDVPITPSAPFNVGSVAKQFTAAAVLLLAEQGKLSMDDDVRKYIPELPDFGVTIRVRHLLHHTSGLREQIQLLQLAGWRYPLDFMSETDVMSLVRRQKDLNFPPGSNYLYSNTGFMLLGQIVKKVSGLSLREFTTKNIFEPLGMRNSHFRDDHSEIIKGEALGYVPTKDGVFRLSVPNSDIVGSSSLYTTVEDLAKWEDNFYSPKIGGPDFTLLMTKTEKLTSGTDNNYALGLVIGNYRGLPTVEHGGSDAGYRSDIIRFPQQHFSVISLCNTPANPVVLNRAVADLYLTADFKKKAVQVNPNERESVRLSPEEIAGKDGFYRLRDGGLVMKIDSENGALRVVEDDDKTPLLADGKGQFALPNLTSVAYFEPAKGSAKRLVIEPLNSPSEIWDRLPEFATEPGEARRFAGSYFGDELDVVYRLEENDGQLVLKRKKYPDQVLRPVIRDVFTCRMGLSMGVFEFTRDSSGRVSGMSLTTSRIWHLNFTRQN